MGAAKPSICFGRVRSGSFAILNRRNKRLVLRQNFEFRSAGKTQDEPRVSRRSPNVRIDALPNLVDVVRPRPTQVQREVAQSFQLPRKYGYLLSLTCAIAGNA